MAEVALRAALASNGATPATTTPNARRSIGTDLSTSGWKSMRLRRVHETLKSRDVSVRKPAASRIVGVEFSILSEEDVLAQSRVQVTHGSSLERGEPRHNGLNSLLMAPVDRRTPCLTCGGPIESCPGHPGHATLAVPLYVPGLMDSALRVLRCVCFFCSEPLFDAARAEEAASSGNALQRDKLLARAAKKVCLNKACKGPQPKYVKDPQKLAIHAEWSPAAADLLLPGEESEWARRPFTAYRAKQILGNVSDSTLEAMGMVPSRSHIKNAVMTKLPIPPTPVRPVGQAADGGSNNGRGRGTDDLTNKLHEILKRNRSLEEHLRKQSEKNGGRPPDPDDLDAEALELQSDLQLEFASYLDDRYEGKVRGKVPGQAMGGAKRPKKSIKQRISGKQGRIRGNLLGKRVDFAARTVVVPDPNLALDEVGVPESIALDITKNVVVNAHNLADLAECVAVGKDVLGGAETVTTESGQRIHLDRALSRPVLLPGMTVQRYLRDGDIVIINRQPSLHRASMMGHRVKIYPGLDRHPFGLNLSVTAPYNADFDGDEMNMHVPQNVEAEAEVQQLMCANNQIVSSQACAPVMGLVHDGALGAYLLSMPDAFFDAAAVGDLSLEGGFDSDRLGRPAILKPARLWTGKQVLSALLPRDFRFQKTVGSHEAERSVRPDPAAYPSRYRLFRALASGPVVAGQPLAEIRLLLDPADDGEEGPVLEIPAVLRAPRAAARFDLSAPPNVSLRCGVSPIGELDEEPVHVGTLKRHSVAVGDEIGSATSPRFERAPVVATISFGDWELPVRTSLRGRATALCLRPGDPAPASASLLEIRVDGPFDPDLSHHSLEISDGSIVRGFLAKTGASVGRSPNSIVHTLALTRGSQVAADFLGATQRVCNRWFLGRGFSVGLKDVVPSARAARKARRAIDRVEASVHKILEEAESEGFDPTKIEQTVRNMLRGVVDAVGVEVADDVPPDNRIALMKDAGSKGNLINLVQMMFCTGQQIVEGVRPSAKDPSSAILSRFAGGDNAPDARAFVRAALSGGLTFSEFFFYCMAGREGLCDTAVKTAATGYIERRLLKAMESLYFSLDGRVRNSLNQIVQERFGDGGWDPAKLRKQSLDHLRQSDDDLLRFLEGDRLLPDSPQGRLPELERLRAVSRRRAEILAEGGRLDSTAPDPATGLVLVPEPEWCRLRRLRDDCRRGRLSGLTPSLDSDVYLPFLARDVVSECELLARRRRPDSRHRACEPDVALRAIRAASDTLRGQGFAASSARLAFEGCFTIRRVCRKWKLSVSELRDRLERVATACEAGRCDPGEMVGCVAAQSIGEPAQQMTLNTFHSLGSTQKNVTLGIPRLKKLIETKTKDKSATVFLREPFNRSERAATNVLKAIQCTTLRNVVTISSVEREAPDAEVASPPEDEPVRRLHAAIGLPEERRVEGKSGHVVRFLLHKRTMMERNLVPSDVADAIARFLAGWGADVQCSDANMATWVVRVRLHAVESLEVGGGGKGFGERPTTNRSSEGSDATDRTEADSRAADRAMNEALEAELNKKVLVSGIPGIEGGAVREIRVDSPDPSTGELRGLKEWVVDTKGTALEKLLALEFVDPSRTFSNDVSEVEEVLGIEAAAAVLFHELKQVIYFGGTYIDPRHILLLSHTMTHLGYQVALSRFGINRLETGPLVKMSFEQTYEVCNLAAVQAQIDSVQGPTPSVMMGQLGPLATGVVDLRPTPEYLRLVAARSDPAGDDKADAARVGPKLTISVPRERPRRAPAHPREQQAVRVHAGPDPDEAERLTRKRPVVRFEDEIAERDSLAPTPARRDAGKKRARRDATAAETVAVAIARRVEDLRVTEDSAAWPAPPRMRLFREWDAGEWNPLVWTAVGRRCATT